MGDHETAAVLTEAERDDLTTAAYGTGDDRPAALHAAVSRLLRARLAAQPPQDDPQPDEREALEASREQVHDLLELLDGERQRHANALVMAWAEGYGSGSSEATDDWVRPGTARRRRNPYLLDRVAAHDNDRAALAEPTPGSESP